MSDKPLTRIRQQENHGLAHTEKVRGGEEAGEGRLRDRVEGHEQKVNIYSDLAHFLRLSKPHFQLGHVEIVNA